MAVDMRNAFAWIESIVATIDWLNKWNIRNNAGTRWRRLPCAENPKEDGKDKAKEDIEKRTCECCDCACFRIGERQFASVFCLRFVRWIQLRDGDIAAKRQEADDEVNAFVFEPPDFFAEADGEFVHMEFLPDGGQQMAEFMDENAESEKEDDENDDSDIR